MQLIEEAMMYIRRRVEVGIGLIAAMRTPEQLSPFFLDAFSAPRGEPLPLRAASAAILTGAMWIDFDGDSAFSEGLLAGVLIDLAPHLVRLSAVAPPGCASSPGLDFPEPLKEQDAAWILRAHVGDATRNTMGCVFVHATNMLPQLLVALLPFHRLARLPLLLGNAFEVAVARLIEALISHEDRFPNRSPLPDGNDCKHLHVQIDGHRDQVGIPLALDNLLRFHFLCLGEVE